MNLRSIYKHRPKGARKGDYGRLLIVGGSERYTGSPIFNALAALRAGCDITIIAAPDRAANIAAAASPDLITVPLLGRTLDHHLSTIADLLKQADTLVIGGGLGRAPVTVSAVQHLLASCEIPLVVDADALYALRENGLAFAGRAVLTPHAGEVGELFGRQVPSTEGERKEAAIALATRFHAVVLLKGYRDVITDGRKVILDTAHSPYLTKGGVGDLTAGVVGALLARGVKPLQAAQAAAYIIGKAGALAAKHYRESLLASDLLDFFPEILP